MSLEPAPKHSKRRRKYSRVQLPSRERDAVRAVLRPGETFRAAMREAAELLVRARSAQ